MKRKYSIKLEFIIMYFCSFVIPILVSTFIMSTYLKTQYSEQTTFSLDNQLATVSENVSTYLDDLNRVTTLPYYNKDFIDSLTMVLKDNTASEYDRFLADNVVREVLTNIMMISRKEIISTILVTDDKFVSGANRKSNESSFIRSFDFSQKPWYMGAKKFNGDPYVTGVHSQDYFLTESGTKVFSVARQIKDPSTGQNLAVIMADANTSVFDDIFSNLKNNIPSKFVLLDEGNNIIYSTDNIPSDTLALMGNNKIIKEGKESYSVKIINVGDYNWKIAMLVSDSSLKRQLLYIYEVCIFFAVGGLIVTYIIFDVLSRHISNPLQKMMKVIKEVEKGNFNVRVSKFKVFEIDELGNALNSMTKKLFESIEKEYKLVIQQKNAEFKALRAQIQPHFLYNTLNGFIGLNRLGERELLEKSILDLTGMLRYALEDRNLVTIKEEFDSIREYSNLQLLRFEERMQVEIQYEEEIKNYLIPKFLLQPLVENAIIHGIEPSAKACTLKVEARRKGHLISFTIEDDGIGFEVDTLQDGVGVGNTRSRAELFNKNSRFYINSIPGEGTFVEITIPEEELKIEDSDS